MKAINETVKAMVLSLVAIISIFTPLALIEYVDPTPMWLRIIAGTMATFAIGFPIRTMSRIASKETKGKKDVFQKVKYLVLNGITSWVTIWLFLTYLESIFNFETGYSEILALIIIVSTVFFSLFVKEIMKVEKVDEIKDMKVELN